MNRTYIPATLLAAALALGIVLAPPQVLRAEDDHDKHGEEALEAHDDHDEHAEEDAVHREEAGHSEGLKLTPEQRRRFGIQVARAGPGRLHAEARLPGEIVFNEDRVVHLVPRVEGIARAVHKTVGDPVEAGDVLAVIDSRELADVRTDCLSARARRALAHARFTREAALHEKGVSSEEDFLDAQQALTEADIALQSAEQKLITLGLSTDDLTGLEGTRNDVITRYEIRSPISGVVVEKHIALGENLETTSDIFTIADLGSVWVNLAVYTKHLADIRKGQRVVLRSDHNGQQVESQIVMVTPFVEAVTRSATARVVLDNPAGRWVPGTFVTGFVRLSEEEVPVLIPRGAVQVLEGRHVVFREHAGAFEIQPVTTGHGDRDHIEIVAGLEPGDTYVARGAFELKATVITSSLDAHAGHGH